MEFHRLTDRLHVSSCHFEGEQYRCVPRPESPALNRATATWREGSRLAWVLLVAEVRFLLKSLLRLGQTTTDDTCYYAKWIESR